MVILSILHRHQIIGFKDFHVPSIENNYLYIKRPVDRYKPKIVFAITVWSKNIDNVQIAIHGFNIHSIRGLTII